MKANGSARAVRLMFVSPCFGFGGLEQVILETISNMDRSRFKPYFCTLFPPEREMAERLEKLGVECKLIEKGDGFNLSLIFKLAKLMRREKIQIVNSHDIGATLFAAPAAMLAGVKRVIHTEHSQILAVSRWLSVYGWILRNLVSHCVAVSQDLADFLVSRMGIHSEKVTMIPNGIDVSRFAGISDASRVKKELGLADDRWIVGTIGRLMEQKGTEHLIRAHSKVLSEAPDAFLVIVGDGVLRRDLVRLVDELGIGDSVRFAGIREDIPEMLAMFDIFVLPSLWEGQPMTIIEAMAAGKPVVATDVGGNDEILLHGERGILIPPRDHGALKDAILRLYLDRELAGSLGRKAGNYAAAELTSIEMTRKHERIFGLMTEGASDTGLR